MNSCEDELPTPETDADREAAERRLGEMRHVTAILRPLLSDPLVPASGSELAQDDLVHPEYPVSQVAWTGIRSSLDAMSTFFASLDGDGVAYETGHRVLARSALNGAAQALFVLASNVSKERTSHALRLTWDDLRSYERAITDMRDMQWTADLSMDGAAEGWEEKLSPVKDRQRRVLAAADRTELSKTQLKKTPELREMADYAAKHVGTDQENMRNAVRLTLSQLNSAVHSGRWHTLLGTTHVVDTPTGPRAQLVTTATDLMLMAGGPMILTPRAIQLFRARSSLS